MHDPWPTPIDPTGHAWLVEDSPEALVWQAAQDAAARQALAALPHFDAVRELVAHVAPTPAAGGLPLRGGMLRTVPSDAGPGPALILDAADGSSRTVLDTGPQASALGKAVGLEYAVPSPDGRYVVLGIGPRNAEASTLRVLDLEAGELLPVEDPRAGRAIPAWLPDGSGFLYSAGVADDTEDLRRVLKEYVLGEDAPRALGLDTRGREWLQPQISPRYAVALVYEGNFLPRPWYVRAHDDPHGAWRPFLRDTDGEIRGEFIRDVYVAVELVGASLGRLVAIPLDAGADRTRWREILPESELALRGVRHLGGGLLLVTGLDDGIYRGLLVRPDGTIVATVEPPEPGITHFPVAEYMNLMPSVPEDAPAPAEFLVAHSAFQRAPVRFAVDTATGALRQVSEPSVAVEGLVRRRIRVTTDDGVDVTVDLVHREDAAPDEAMPGLVWAYGGFNATGERTYDSLLVAFAASGGLVVLPHLRGGAERGWPWWHAGRRERKQRTFDDLYTVVEHLRGTGLAGRVGFIGASNGGMLAGVAVTQRPDLFAAAASMVPVTDLRRIVRDPWGAFRCMPEYGDPRVPEEAEWIADYSPYHAVRAGVDYPPVIVVAGANDRRTFPWHARVLAAALQDAGADAHLLAVPDDGHFAVMDPAQQHWWLAFLMHHLDLTPAPVDTVTVRRPSA